VFLVGSARSGTTLLQRMLNAHPLIAIAPETHYVRTYLYGRGHRRLRSTRDVDELLRAIVRSSAFTESGVDADAFRRACMRTDRSHGAILTTWLRQFGDLHDASVVGEKTPNHVRHINELTALVPGARFVHIVRDPRGVVNSVRATPWSKGACVLDAGVWDRSVRDARRAERQGRPVLTIRFEDLVTQPEQTLRPVLQFIGVEFDPVVLAHESVADPTVNVEREPWKADTLRPVDARVASRWTGELTGRQVVAIESVTSAMMHHHGYIPQTAPMLSVPVGAASRTWIVLDQLLGRARRVVRRAVSATGSISHRSPRTGRSRRR
jgi:hypothetical protein